MADVTTVDTHVQANPIQVAIRVDIQNHELRAADAAELLLSLSELAGLIAGSDFVELAEADPVDAERWKSLSLVVKEMTSLDSWEIVTILPGCTPEQTHAFVKALTSIQTIVQDQKGDKEGRDEDALFKEAAQLLVKDSKDVPRSPPVEKIRDLALRLSALAVTIVQVTVRHE